MNAIAEPPVIEVASAQLPTRWGMFRIYGFEMAASESSSSRVDTAVALVMGNLNGPSPLVRIQSECLTGDVFRSCRCDCGDQLHLSLAMIAAERRGIIIYERQEGRGIGLMWKLRAYGLQDQGLDTIEANEYLGFKVDYRKFTLPARILESFHIKRLRLLSNNPEKLAALARRNIEVVERVPCEVDTVSPYALDYLAVKKNKLGHFLSAL